MRFKPGDLITRKENVGGCIFITGINYGLCSYYYYPLCNPEHTQLVRYSLLDKGWEKVNAQID